MLWSQQADHVFEERALATPAGAHDHEYTPTLDIETQVALHQRIAERHG
jgi:hypothetical protein